MKFISEIICNIAEKGVPLFIVFIIIGAISSILNFSITTYTSKMKKIGEKMIPEIKEIKNKHKNEAEQLIFLNELYRKNHYHGTISSILKLIMFVFNIIVFLSVIQFSKFPINENINVSFLGISNILEKNTLIYIPMVLTILTIILALFEKSPLKFKISLLIMNVLNYIILCNIFITSYSLYLLGKEVVSFIIKAILLIKNKKAVKLTPTIKEN